MVKYLLDTHVIIWIAEDSSRISDTARNAISDTNVEKHVSIISPWEVAIKLGTGKLNIVGGLSEYYHMIDSNNFFVQSIKREHLRLISTLPRHHRDPFDRLLIATAIVEGMTLITADENIHKYDMPWLW
jgi:PIN domain nuclease of toxin-antitoxin system